MIQAFNIKQYKNLEALKIIEQEINEDLEEYWASDTSIMKDIHPWAEEQSWISAEGLQTMNEYGLCHVLLEKELKLNRQVDYKQYTYGEQLNSHYHP